MFLPASGAYPTSQSITIACATNYAFIRYTTDGSDPSSSRGTLYSGAFTLGAAKTIKAIAYLSGYNDSAIATATYTISGGIVVTPVDGTTYNVTINGLPATLPRSTLVTVTATASQSVNAYAWYIDGQLQSGSSSSFTVGAGLGMGPHDLTVVVRSGSVTYSKSASFTVVPFISPSWNFESGSLGSASCTGGSWTLEAPGAGGSQYAARSAAIGNSAATSLQIQGSVPNGKTLSGISFKRKISTEANFDKLNIYCNGNLLASGWSGEQDWATTNLGLNVASGQSYTIKFTYSKDSTGVSGSDCVWIDDIFLQFQ